MCSRFLTLLFALLFALWVRVAAAQPREAQEIHLAVGEQQVLPSEGVRSYSEGVKGIIDVRLTRDGSQFVIVGLAPGSTTLLFLLHNGGERHFKISVGAPALEEPKADPTRVEARDNIRLDFYFVQLVKNYNHQFGVTWPTHVTWGPTPQIALNFRNGSLSGDSVVINSVLPGLDLAQSAGWAKVLRKAAVITANGTEATFSGGGEVNVIAAGGLQSTISRIEFGSVVKVEPRYDGNTGRIELKVNADISDLAPDNGTRVPGRTTSRLNSVVNLELGQSLVLAGLSASTKSKTRSGVPGLSQIPILGILFGSDRLEQQDTENLVLIVPSVVDVVAEQKRGRIREALQTFEAYQGKIAEANLNERLPAQAAGKKGKR
jgi:pilus assembly protein CpaC